MNCLRNGILLSSLALIALACTDPTLNEFAPHSGLIRGTVLYPSGTARGNVIITLFAEDKLPPPQGTSSPVNFVVIPEARLFKGVDADVVGDFSASFTIPAVPAGRYQIRAFLDADGDFNPIYDLLKQPTAGDVGGGYVDLQTKTFKIVEVQTDQISQAGIVVTLGQVIPVERPAFAYRSETKLKSWGGLQYLSIQSHPIRRRQVTMDPEKTAFLIQYVDENRDGIPDDSNFDHLPDIYPKFILKRRGENADFCEPKTDCAVIVPVVTNPNPYLDTLDALGAAMTRSLDLIVPPVAVVKTADGIQVLSEIPPGEYDGIVISGTGQTWTVPNLLDQLQPSGMDASQSAMVTVEATEKPAMVTISGKLTVASEIAAEAYVFAFLASDPPPPVGTGLPRAVASLYRTQFSTSDGTRSAKFSLEVPAGGPYLVSGLYDVDSNFSLLADLLSQPSLGDLTLKTPVLIEGVVDQEIDLRLDEAYESSRPIFVFDEGQSLNPVGISRFTINSHSLPRIQSSTAAMGFDVVMTSTDANDDNLADLFPKIILLKVGGDIGEKVIIPSVVDPIEFLSTFGDGASSIKTQSLDLLVPPLALTPNASGGWMVIRPIPAGEYQLNLINAAGQTWSLPNDFNASYARTGTPLEDQTQNFMITVPEQSVPAGEIHGRVTLVDVLPPSGDYSVIVTAFDVNALPPPAGSGRPKAFTRLSKVDFSGGSQADYSLGGLATGDYQVRAFIDSNDDFVFWFDTHNQPDAGDVGGGHFSATTGGFASVSVDALAMAGTNIDVSILSALRFAVDRPVFEFDETDLSFPASSTVIPFQLKAINVNNDVLKADGVFVVKWVDRDGDGQADDVNGDGQPDVYPLVVVEWLDENDAEHLQVNATRRVLSGIVNPAQFAAAGFAAGDPSATQSVVLVNSLSVIMPMLAIDPDQPGSPLPPPSGNYRVTLIQATGQTWTVPNDLQRAQGTALAESQAGYISITP